MQVIKISLCKAKEDSVQRTEGFVDFVKCLHEKYNYGFAKTLQAKKRKQNLIKNKFKTKILKDQERIY